MATICVEQHVRILHEEKECPLCKAEEKIAKLEDEKTQLEGTIEDLHNQILEYKS